MNKRNGCRLAIWLICFGMLFLTGCINKNSFDFSRLNDMECEGEWGIPLFNAQYSIEDILTMADNPDFMQIGDNGTVQILYEYEMDSVVSASHYLESYFHNELQTSGGNTFLSSSLPEPVNGVQVLAMDTLQVHFPDDEIYIVDAVIKSGVVTVKVNYDIPNQVHLTAYSPQLTDASGQIFHIDEYSSGGYFEKDYDVSGFTLVTENNMADIYLTITCPANNPLPYQMTFGYEVLLSQVLFSEIRGNFAAVTMPVDEEWDFTMSFLQEHFTGGITLLNPNLTCEIMNTFPVNGQIKFDEAMLSGEGVSSSLINSSTDFIDLPASTTQFTPVQLPLASSVFISPNFNHFHLSGTAIINPSGISAPMLTLTEDQFINLRFKLTLPLMLSIDNATYQDTIDFGGIVIPDQLAFSNLLVRMGINNALPLNFNMQAYFYDSTTGTVQDSLFTAPRTVLSAYRGIPRSSELFATVEDFYEMQRMLSCDQIILKAKVFTDGGSVIINANQYLKVVLSAKFNMDVNQLVDIGK